MNSIEKTIVSPVQALVKKKNLLIAGPCSAESEQQVLRTAKALAREGRTDIFRAGIWKPRTSPGGFEGAGVKGLPWLVKAKEETGLPFAVEIATAQHAEQALAFGADLLWVGARTTVNPFSVQEIAQALRGTDCPVLVKNPVNPELRLWAGAVERIQRCGTENILLVHRGFSAYGNSSFRNAPNWPVAIEMKRIFPGLPMICDPSHICGKKETLRRVAQQSIDLDFDGLMIEAHIDPLHALTDREQQLCPDELTRLLDSLVFKTREGKLPANQRELQELRTEIDTLDEDLLNLLSRRMQVSLRIGNLKKANRITVLQSARWNEVLERSVAQGKKLGLSEDFVRNWMQSVHEESIRLQS